jgi:NADH:ubiquinone oxidoreductase subunit 6 (subunit J)
MMLELLAIGLVVSAFLAVYLDEVIYAVASLGCTYILMAIVYVLNGAVYAAVFQLAIGAGTMVILFLSAEMLSEKPAKRKPLKNTVFTSIAALFLSFPAVFLSFSYAQAIDTSNFDFEQALWNLRGVDVILQGLVILSVALGVAIILHKRNEGGK